MTEVAEAVEHPELAALSVMSHGDDISVVRAFVSALKHLPDDHAPQYYEYAYRLASEAARRVMEEMMESAAWPVYSPFARKHYGRGREEGRAEGRAEGEARAVLTILEVRGIAVSDADRVRITGCTDLERLDEWARRAVTVTSAADLFTDED